MKKITAILLAAAILCCLLPGCQQKEAAPMNVLAIGSYAQETVEYLEELAALGGYEIHSAYLLSEGQTLRDLASAFMKNALTFTLYEESGTTPATGAYDVLAKTWDVVILQQAVLYAGFPGTYNSDLIYLADLIRDKTGAQVLFNMSWAAENHISEDMASLFGRYEKSSAYMYNAIVDCTEASVMDNPRLDGWIPIGAVLEQLRTQVGNVTVDGHHLTDAGSLAASLTILKTLVPEFDLSLVTPEFSTELPVEAIVAAVKGASLTKVDAPAVAVSENADITVAQVAPPLNLHFPDLAVLDDGTIIVAAYENICHAPTSGAGNMQEGVGRLILWTSSDNGATWNYDDPLLVVDEAQMNAWGIVVTENRYKAIQSGNNDYVVMADPRDPNLAVSHTDMDGDGKAEETLLLTFWTRCYTETGTLLNGYLVHSVDGGKSWSAPQELKQSTGNNILKRGNIASFSDGQILIPYYWSKRAGSLLMEYDTKQAQWVLLHDSDIVNFEPLEGKNFNEVSLVAPDPDSDTVYAYCRENGTVLCSLDRGATWKYIANEGGLIHQPGFTILDKDRVFVTWALTARPRHIFGKVFQVDKGWDTTKSQLLYLSPDQSAHDMGDPSCARLPDGRVLVICYDTAYRSIVGNYVDPNK